MDSFNPGRAADRFLQPEEGPSAGTPSHDGASRSHVPSRFSLGRLVRVLVCAVFYGLFYFVQQVTELLAPLLLIVGVGWSVLPHVIGAIGTSAASADPQARDIVTHVAGTIPHQIVVGSHVVTAMSLVTDGLLMMAAAALCATLAAVAAREM
ncbi:conserved hypothetical protein [Gluconacetobacter diazotrophicus PA1 5]|nr:hypothetical protein [Gluconacetobacter diazotrophicus]ACI52803.1 conserved hypothetical protein [Gluconacetobacter diazotrophicus PA1 5]TWB09052.1 hypothetical protein FBZ86_105158 [Gluconacetobacter diazotrophicus]